MTTNPSTPGDTRTDARQVRSRNALLAAMLELIETVPFDQVTIREIARVAGIGYATFFRHYPSKEALLHDLAAGEIAGLLQYGFPVLLAADRRRSCAAVFEFVAEHRTLWSVLLTGGAATMLKQEFVEQAKRLAAHQPAMGGWLPDELRVIFGVSTTVEILAWWLRPGNETPIERMAEILDRLVVAPAMAFE